MTKKEQRVDVVKREREAEREIGRERERRRYTETDQSPDEKESNQKNIQRKKQVLYFVRE